MDINKIKKQVLIGIDKVIATDFKPIYTNSPTISNPRGVSNITESHDKSGVYMILEKSKKYPEGEIVYIGMSSYDLYKTIHRHFQKWKDKEQRNRISYKDRILKGSHTYEIAIIETTPKTAKLLEKELILMYLPRDNKEKINYYSERSDEDILKQYFTFLKHQYKSRRATLLKITKNPEKYRNKSGFIDWKKIEEARKTLKKIEKEKP